MFKSRMEKYEWTKKKTRALSYFSLIAGPNECRRAVKSVYLRSLLYRH